MNTVSLFELKTCYRNLLTLCKGGPVRKTAVPDDKLAQAQNDREFCAIALLNYPEASFLSLVFGLKERWMACASSAPAIDAGTTEISVLQAQAYLDDALQCLRRLVLECDLAQVEQRAYDAVYDHATEFVGKLVHSDARTPALIHRGGTTALPHLSSRSLARSGCALPLDQIKNDSTGTFQRILKLLNDDALVQSSQAPQEALDAVKRGAERALHERAQGVPVHSVDHRLRQILLPICDKNYIAVSPLPATGMAAVLKQVAAQYLQQNPDVQQSMTPKADNAHIAEVKKEQRKKYLDRLEIPYGGSKTQNVSLQAASIIQQPFNFAAPQPSASLARLLRFKHSAWHPNLPTQIKSALEQVAANQVALQSADHSVPSLSEVQRLANGAIADLARSAHWAVLNLAADLGLYNEAHSGADAINEQSMTRSLTRMDRFILEEDFGNGYREMLADALLGALRRSNKTIDALNGLYAGTLIKRALIRVLEQSK